MPSIPASRPKGNNRAALLIAIGLVVGAGAVWVLGYLLGVPILRFGAVMSVASTFVPLPADSYVLAAATQFPPLTIAIVGGAASAVAVLVERAFVRRIMHRPVFDRLRGFVGTNRFVDHAERHMFTGLVIAAVSPLPFEVFRLIAVTRYYPAGRYALATFIGRGTRFYLLASVGVALAARGVLGWVVLATLLAFALSVSHSTRRPREVQPPLLAPAA